MRIYANYLSLLVGLFTLSALVPAPLPPVRSVTPGRDTLPAGTRISITIQQPGETSSNRIDYTVPAPPAPVKPIDPATVVLSDGLQIGTRGTSKLIIRVFEGKAYLTEVLADGSILVRGPNLLRRGDVNSLYKTRENELTGGETGWGGLDEPKGFKKPDGLIRKQFGDGAVYYVPDDRTGSVTPIPKPIDPAPVQPDPVPDTKPITQPLPFPSDEETLWAQVARLGSQRQGLQLALPYRPEPKASFEPTQFGTGKAFADNYRFSVDFNPHRYSVEQLRGLGQTMFSRFLWGTDDAPFRSLPAGDRWYYQTENELHGPYEGAKYFESDLADIEAWYYHAIPSNMGHWVANIETSNGWRPYMYDGSGRHGYDSWEVAKNRRIRCEFDGQVRSLEELQQSGLWDREEQTRRTNRLTVGLTLAKERNGQALYGSSMWQGIPWTTALNTAEVFQEGYADVSRIGGDGDGNISLNGRRYKLTGSVWDAESAMCDYFYYFNFTLSRPLFNDIYLGSDLAKKTYPTLWAAMDPFDIVGSEKGHYQANAHRMLVRQGRIRGSYRMLIGVFEDNRAGIIGGRFPGEAARPPQPELANTLQWTDSGKTLFDTPKIWLPPYMPAGAYTVHRFLSGDRPQSGYHHWESPQRASDPLTVPYYNHELHTVTNLWWARHNLQPLEFWYSNTTLTEDPLVQINRQGDYRAYSGAEAFGRYPDGTSQAPKPSYIVRSKAVKGGTQVAIVGGYPQGWYATRRDNLQVPALPGVTFDITLFGPQAHVYCVFVPTGQAGPYTLTPSLSPETSRPGYAGRILTDTITK